MNRLDEHVFMAGPKPEIGIHQRWEGCKAHFHDVPKTSLIEFSIHNILESNGYLHGVRVERGHRVKNREALRIKSFSISPAEKQ